MAPIGAPSSEREASAVPERVACVILLEQQV
jgi:hypothetical protein